MEQTMYKSHICVGANYKSSMKFLLCLKTCIKTDFELAPEEW